MLIFAFWILTVGLASTNWAYHEPDLWGHLFYGMQHLSSGSLALTDTYSYTAYGLPWINHEWLSELLLALAWRSAGAAGLWVVRLLIIAFILGIILRLIRQSTKGFWTGLIFYLLFWLGMGRYFTFRPQLFTFLFFALFLYIIHKIYLQCRWSPWWSLVFVPLMCLWVNLHGGFIVGLALISWLNIYLLVEWLQHHIKLKRVFIALSAWFLSLAATLINPYGIGLWAWLVRSLSASRAFKIIEWAPMYARVRMYGIESALPYIIMSIVAIVLIAMRRKRYLFEWGVLIPLCIAAFINLRHEALFFLAFAVFLPKHLEATFSRAATYRSFNRAFVLFCVILCSILSVGINLFPGYRMNIIRIKTKDIPFNAIKFIHNNGLRGNLLVYFNWAQAAIWYLHDSCKVAFDGRFRTVYPMSVENDYFYFNKFESQWTNLIDNYSTQIILMPASWAGIEALSRRGDWQLVYRSMIVEMDSGRRRKGENTVLFIRRNAFPEFESRLQDGRIIFPEPRTEFRFGEPINDITLHSTPKGLAVY
jgi:hypothetical protein